MDSITIRPVDRGQKEYCTSFPISKYPIGCNFSPRQQLQGRDREQIGEKAASLTEEVGRIIGVDGGRISKNILTIKKNRKVEWKEIEPDIIKALKNAHGSPSKVEVIYLS